MNKQFELISKAISENGHRMTSARQAIVAALIQSQGHITADDLASLVHKQAPQVGRMTVYRTLDLLSEIGVIRPIYQGTGAAHYILMAEGSHHHLICNRCHDVIEFDDCFADELAQLLAEQFNFEVKSHLLEMHGFCENCVG